MEVGPPGPAARFTDSIGTRPMKPPARPRLLSELRTIDGFPLEDGMLAWDYDLEPVRVDFSTAKPEYADGDQWFYCDRILKPGSRSLMNSTRLWVRHPSTGKRVLPLAQD